MKTKLFLAFLAVIILALVSNFIFGHLMDRDFDEYVKSTRHDQLYWVMAAVEGSHEGGRWNRRALGEAIHWGLMMGFEIEVEDVDGRMVMGAPEVVAGLDHGMRHRMAALVDAPPPAAEVDEYPLFMQGREIGTMKVRELPRRGSIAEKERTFKRRSREFLVISFVIAGGGAVILALLFSVFLTKPVAKLKQATKEIANGNFDITVDVHGTDEIGRLARSFKYMSEALKKEDEIRRRLTSNIAHELRTPLTVMKASLEGVADGVVECSSEQVANLREEVDGLIKLVEGIEDLTRAEASFIKHGPLEEIELGEVLRRHALGFRQLADEKGIGLTVAPAGEVRVITDAGKIDTIVKNLVSNAIRFTAQGAVSLEYGLRDGRAFIRVSDTGRGMDREEQGHIFERFYKGRESQGTGVGLSIVRELVVVLGGDISVRSEPGKGSAFTVIIPQGGAPE